tara:strand:+ start:26569 stop:27687 length:1119 start_codon:yes stop_codon:yes gene_type:complete
MSSFPQYHYTKKGLLLILFAVSLICCKTKAKPSLQYNSPASVFEYYGRILKNDSLTTLISSASGVEFNASGDSLVLMVKSDNGSHNYFALSIDGQYHDRYQINSDSINNITIALPDSKTEWHEIGLYKATEAANGTISFYGAKAKEISPTKRKRKTNIEFIGNSITCGMGADLSIIPCGEGEWFDQHNAYLAYGPRVARSLNANYELNSVSGIGMYRNWNDENLTEPIMPDVYDNLFLNADSLYPYTYNYVPNIICICLGTNDMSDGDGIKSRLPFSKEEFVTNYKKFIGHLFKRNTKAKIVLLTSPIFSGEKRNILLESLQEVKEQFVGSQQISIFEFEEIQPNGCTSHPNIAEHKIMAEQLEPFLKKLID